MRLLRFQIAVSVLMALLCFGLSAAHAAALTQERATPSREGGLYALTVASNVVIYRGALVSRDANGYAIPASDTAGSTVIGCAPYSVDNRTAVYHPSRTIAAQVGIFGWTHTGFTAADVGSLAYVLDDATVTPATNVSQDIVAGVIVGVEGTTCWVDTGGIPRQGAQSVASIAVSGNATVGGTLAVSGNSTLGGTTVTVTNRITAASYGTGGNLGWSGVVTNQPGATNTVYYSAGLVTNVVRNP